MSPKCVWYLIVGAAGAVLAVITAILSYQYADYEFVFITWFSRFLLLFSVTGAPFCFLLRRRFGRNPKLFLGMDLDTALSTASLIAFAISYMTTQLLFGPL